MEESNVQFVSSPVTVSADKFAIHGVSTTYLENESV
jgi:hypothetical protein